MRRALAHEIAFLLIRAAAKIDTGYTLLLAKTLTRVAQARDATVQVEIARPLAERLSNWSEPVQIQFRDTDDGWVMYVRSCERTMIEQIQAIAARQ
jgi:hypothetical protein